MPLGLPGWMELERQEINGRDTLIVAEMEPGAPLLYCPKCGEDQPKLHRHDSLTQRFTDTPMFGKRVKIELRRQRWRHLDCGGTFLAPINSVDEKRNITFMFEWKVEHAQAVEKWKAEHIPTYKKLIDFSEHTFDSGYYKTTIIKTPETLKFHKVVEEARPQSSRDHSLLREYWKRNFEKEENRVPVWK